MGTTKTEIEKECLLLHSKPVKATMDVSWDGALGEPIPLCEDCYKAAFGKGIGYKIVHYDPSNEVSGLQVINPESRRVIEDHLWFYTRNRLSPLFKSMERAGEIAEKIASLEWEIAEIIEGIKSLHSRDLQELGYENIYAFTKSIGIDSATAKRLIRAVRNAKGNGQETNGQSKTGTSPRLMGGYRSEKKLSSDPG